MYYSIRELILLQGEESLEDVGEEVEEEGAALQKYGNCLSQIFLSSTSNFFKIKTKIKKNKIQIKTRSSMKMLMKWKPN